MGIATPNTHEKWGECTDLKRHHVFLWYACGVTNQLGSYHLKEILGAGSQTTVYRGVHRNIPHLEVAVKLLHPHLSDLPQAREALKERATVLAQLHHPRVVQLLDYIEEGPACGMIVERVNGKSLASRLAQEERFSIPHVQTALRGVLEAIGHAHGQGFAHGKLNLDKVWLTEGGWLKLLDFAGGQASTAAIRMDLVSIGQLVGSVLLGEVLGHRSPTQSQLERAGASTAMASLLTGLCQTSPDRNFGSCGEALAALEAETGQREDRKVINIAFPAGHVDFAKQVVEYSDGSSKRLAGVERELLMYLARYPGQVISRERLMREVWNVRGHVITRAVDVTVRRIREKIEHDASNPAHILTVHGQGYRFEPPREAVEPAPTVTQAPILAPPNTPAIVGRKEDMSRLQTLFDEGAHLVTVVGPGGMGKTTLSRVYAQSHGQRKGVRIFFCDLQATTDLESLVVAVANALEVPIQGGENDVALIGGFLKTQGSSLVILDNFEQVATLASETLGQWIEQSPQTRFLVTSQALLGLQDERVHELLPLAQEEAVALFVDRARALRREFSPDGEDLEAIKNIVGALDGIPLPIELAASRIRVLSPTQLFERLSDRLDLLKQRNREASGRTATLRGAIEWSWQLLSPEEKDLLAQAAVFSGGFSAEAAECVLDPGEADLFVLEVLESLVDKSLLRSVRLDHLPGERRFLFFESIHHFCRERLDELPDRNQVRIRHREYYLGEGERIAERVRGGMDARDSHRLALELDNLLSIERDGESSPEDAVRAALCVEPLLAARGPIGVYSRVLDSAVANAQNLTPEFQVKTLLARVNHRRDRPHMGDQLLADLTAARTAANQDTSLTAMVDYTEARTVLVNRGKISEGRLMLQSALSVFRETGNRIYQAEASWQLARCAELEADFSTAEQIARRAIAEADAAGLHGKAGNLHRMLGVMLCNCSRLEEAETEILRALEIFETFGDAKLIATCQIVLGDICLCFGRLEEARKRVDIAHRISITLGNATSAGLALCNQGRVELDRSAVKEARRILLQAVPLLDSMLPGRCLSLMHIAASWIFSKEYERAAQAAKDALDVLDPGYFLIGEVFCRMTYAIALIAKEDLDGATEQLDQAEPHLEKLEATSQISQVLCRTLLAQRKGETSPPPPDPHTLEYHAKRSAEIRLFQALINSLSKN